MLQPSDPEEEGAERRLAFPSRRLTPETVMPCKACPFAFTPESEAIQMLDCLLTPYEAMQIMRHERKNWVATMTNAAPAQGK